MQATSTKDEISLNPIFIKYTFTLLQISKPNVILINYISFSGSRGSPAFPGGSTLGIKMKKKDGSIGGSKSASKAASRAGSACSQFSTHSKRSLKGDNKVLQPPVRFPFWIYQILILYFSCQNKAKEAKAKHDKLFQVVPCQICVRPKLYIFGQ